MISASDTLDGFLSLHNDEGPVAYPGKDEVVLSGGLAENLGVSPGDTVKLSVGKLGTIEAVVSSLCDNYVFNYAYLSAQTYREHLYEDPEYNTLYMAAREGVEGLPHPQPRQAAQDREDIDLPEHVGRHLALVEAQDLDGRGPL